MSDATYDRPASLKPPGQETATILRKWVDEGLYYTHPLRTLDHSDHRRAELYDAGYQWLNKAYSGLDTGGAGASQWVRQYWDPNDPDYIATPVFNEGLPARLNESARIGRPNYRPVAAAKGENPGIDERQGAKQLQDMLRHRLRDMGWDVDKELAYYHMPVYRGVWIKSEWESLWDKLTTVPVKGAVKCPGQGCGFTLASKSVPMRMASQVTSFGDNIASSLGKDAIQVDACPNCKAPMLPFKPTMQEAVEVKDALGRPMGERLPMGDWKLSIRSPYDVFPRNLGFDMRPGQIPDICEAHVEHLDWVSLRYPQKAELVKPESASALAKYHPIASAPDVYQGILDAKTFDCSVRVKARHKLPWMERITAEDGTPSYQMNEGRSVIMAGDVTLLDAPLMMPNQNKPGDKVARVFYDYIPWEIREGGRRIMGMGFWDMIFDPQDTGNDIWSQAGAVRERIAVPIYKAARSMNFELQGLKGGVPGRFAAFDIDPNAPNQAPDLMNNMTIADGAWKELAWTQEAIHDRYTGNARVEGGAPPPGVDAAQAIKALKEASGEKREPRIRRIRTGFRRAYEHGAHLMQANYLEPRDCKYEDEDGEERWAAFTGADLGLNVEVDVEPEEVDSDEKRLKVQHLMDTGVINLADPQTTKTQKRRVAKYLDSPSDLFEDEDLQEKAAQREWIRFKGEEQRPPIVDPDLDDHEEHYREHGRKAHSEWFRHHEDTGGWDDALRILSATWDMDLQQVALSRIPPPPPPPPMPTVAGQPAPPPAPPPIPWVPPTQCIQDQVLAIWMQRLIENQIIPDPNAMPQPTEIAPDPRIESLHIVLVWRAHMTSHRLEAEIKQMRAAVQPTLAAPGADATPQGTQPTAGAPPEQQEAPGAGVRPLAQAVH